MKHWLTNILILTLWLECKGEDRVIQPTGDVIATEGHTVTLGCTFEMSVTLSAYLFWYKQEVNDYPKYMLKRFSQTGDNAAEFQKDRFDATISETSVPLKIQRLQLSDSAVYYCALQPGSGTKMIFGSGTRLNIEASEEYNPSYYTLSDGNTTACLATGFSREKAVQSQYRDVFNKTHAVRISDDSLYNQVALLSFESETCPQGESESGTCEDKLEKDPKVNLMTLTMLGLRLLFIKTVVFNVLMTLRLWISQ